MKNPRGRLFVGAGRCQSSSAQSGPYTSESPGVRVVTNLSYAQGMYASTATTVIHLVQNARWLEVDFTEKGLGVLKLNQEVDIVYDAIPNRVFLGKIVAIDRAISSGVNNKNQLVEISDESRWIRPQQKIRVRVAPEKRNLLIVGGSRASVMVRGSGGIADTWMTVLSWFRFVY
ncbi:efflux RND transporter periplasmic adaptor subunit [Vibrio sp. PP-XX7]